MKLTLATLAAPQVESLLIAERLQSAFDTVRLLHPAQTYFCKIKSLEATKQDAHEALFCLSGFIGQSQRAALAHAMKGEEKQFFFDKLTEMAALISFMPQTYAQDGKGDNALVSLHYFTGGCDWWITEKDMEREQHQAFGLCDLGHDSAEIGYVSLVEILAAGAELDLYFTPCTLATVKEKKGV